MYEHRYVINCSNKKHRVVLRSDGCLAFLDHERVGRELETALTLKSLGGPGPEGCAAFLFFWRTRCLDELCMMASETVARPPCRKYMDRPVTAEDEFLSVTRLDVGTARRLLLRSLRFVNPQIRYVAAAGWFTWHKGPSVPGDSAWPNYLLIALEPGEFMRCAVHGYNVVRRRDNGLLGVGLSLRRDHLLSVFDGFVRAISLDDVEPIGHELSLLSGYDVAVDRRRRNFFWREVACEGVQGEV